ncbi:MAG: circadian clock protein KaiC [Pseudomonadota bacterium]
MRNQFAMLNPSIKKIETGIDGLDFITDGGLPEGRTTLVAGSAGSAKTILAAQYLANAVRQHDEAVVFVTFEESPADIRRNVASFGWPVAKWEADGKWAFVDGTIDPENGSIEHGGYDFGALAARIEYAVRRVGATRLSVDSLGAVFSQFEDRATVRREMQRIAQALGRMGVTSLLTAERTDEYGEISRLGVEEFVADNVIVLRHVLENEKRRRTIEILKLRGTTHSRGEFSFTVDAVAGIVVMPLAASDLSQRSSSQRVTSGNDKLDEISGGGYFRDSIILVSGATGTGKTLLATEFIAGGARAGERCLLLGFEESRDQVTRNAAGWGKPYEEFEREGLLRAECEYPESRSLEDQLVRIKSLIDEFEPQRVAIDSLSALERTGSVKSFREFVLGVTSYIKEKEIPGLFTASTSALMGGSSITEQHISTITDTIILLRYVEMLGEVMRGMTVLKMRGSPHSKQIFSFSVDDGGMTIGRPFRRVGGILSGNVTHLPEAESDRLERLFDDPDLPGPQGAPAQ